MTTQAELRSKLERKEQEISDIAHKIEDRIESYTDWKAMVNDYPLQSVGIAVGAGLLLTGAGGGLMKFLFRQVASVAQAGALAYIAALLTENTEKQRGPTFDTTTY